MPFPRTGDHTLGMSTGATSRRFRARPGAVVRVAREVRDHPANRGRGLRALAHLGSCEIRARMTGRPVKTRLGEHSRIYAYLHRGGSWRAVRANPPDWAEMQAWRRHLGPGGLFVDVGAHAGIYAVWALESGASVVAVEPTSEMVAQIRENLALNHYDADVLEMALAAAPGRMRVAGADLLRRHLVLGESPSASPEGVEVEVGTLDALLGERVARGVKIDVEGAERLVLEGAEHALSQGRIELLQIEWNECSMALLGEDRRPVAALLARHGYALYRPDDTGSLVPVADPEPGPDVFAKRP